MVNDRRKFKRLDIIHIIEINSFTTLLGLIRNFSCQGFSLELTNINFEQKENIKFKFKHPQSKSSVSFLGDVVWEKRVAHTFLAGIKLRTMDKEIKGKLLKILSAIRNIPVDWFNDGRNSEISVPGWKEERSEAQLREHLISDSPTKTKRKIIPNLVIGLSISFLILLGFITFKELIIPVSNTSYLSTPKELALKEHLPESENILIKPVKEPADSKISDDNALSSKPDEIIILKSNKNQEIINNISGEATLSATKSPPVLTINSDNVVTETLINKINKDKTSNNVVKDDNYYSDRGRNFLESARYQEAADAYKQAIKINPYYAEAYNSLGYTYGKTGNYPEAITAYKQAIKINSSNATALNGLGDTYKKVGNYLEAKNVYRQAIRFKPNNVDAHLNLGLTYFILGDKASALDEHKILKDLDTESANKLFNHINP